MSWRIGLYRAIQDNTYSDVIYLDFSKAFDTVPHKRLLHKLQAYGGVQGNMLLWLTIKFSNTSLSTCCYQ